MGLGGNNSSSVCYVTLLVYFLTMTPLRGNWTCRAPETEAQCAIAEGSCVDAVAGTQGFAKSL